MRLMFPQPRVGLTVETPAFSDARGFSRTMQRPARPSRVSRGRNPRVSGARFAPFTRLHPVRDDAFRGASMPGYATRQQLVRLGGHDYRIRALSDRQQFADPDGHAERLGISSAQWCLFGQVWPSGRLLAEAMSHFDVAGKRFRAGAIVIERILRHFREPTPSARNNGG